LLINWLTNVQSMLHQRDEHVELSLEKFSDIRWAVHFRDLLELVSLNKTTVFPAVQSQH
jgi:hypothetical protein